MRSIQFEAGTVCRQESEFILGFFFCKADWTVRMRAGWQKKKKH